MQECNKLIKLLALTSEILIVSSSSNENNLHYTVELVISASLLISRNNGAWLMTQSEILRFRVCVNKL